MHCNINPSWQRGSLSVSPNRPEQNLLYTVALSTSTEVWASGRLNSGEEINIAPVVYRSRQHCKSLPAPLFSLANDDLCAFLPVNILHHLAPRCAECRELGGLSAPGPWWPRSFSLRSVLLTDWSCRSAMVCISPSGHRWRESGEGSHHGQWCCRARSS